MTSTDHAPPVAETSNPIHLLNSLFLPALSSLNAPASSSLDPNIKPSQNPSFGDYQANCAMALAKALSEKPHDIAKKILAALPSSALEYIDPPTIAGPGFINIKLKPSALAQLLESQSTHALGVPTSDDPHPIVVDLCGVNVAKQMHVGHLRATIIGDSLARVFTRLGRLVQRENHLGDWGLPIALVLHHLRSKNTSLDTLSIEVLDAAYRDAQAAMKADATGAVETAAKADLVRLQNGDPKLLEDWHKLIDCTMRSVDDVLDLLSVHLGPDNNHGESFYRDRLPSVIAAFKSSGAAELDDGALIVRFHDRDRPLLIQKSDGGYLYATTDLAALRYRVHDLGASLVIYVVDARQRDHFKDLFDAARKINWHLTSDGAPAKLVHVPFGSVLGPDRKPLKTRSGENITLKALLTEAVQRGTDEVTKRAASPDAPTHNLPPDELAEIGKAVGIGAVKYADLSSDLANDYIFSFDRMIAFDGNTGPYLQYAHARICSIFAKSEIPIDTISAAPFIINHPAERALTLALLRYGSVVEDVSKTLEPHRLCTYLYELANAYSSFYQSCPVLKAEDNATRLARLKLSDLVRRDLADGLSLLGIDAPSRM